MTTFVIQFRHTRPEHSQASLGEVIDIYEPSELGNSGVGGHLSFLYITGVPDNQNKQKMFDLLAAKVQPHTHPRDMRRRAEFRFWELPPPYTDELSGKEITLPFGVALSHLYSRVTDRLMVTGDFDG